MSGVIIIRPTVQQIIDYVCCDRYTNPPVGLYVWDTVYAMTYLSEPLTSWGRDFTTIIEEEI